MSVVLEVFICVKGERADWMPESPAEEKALSLSGKYPLSQLYRVAQARLPGGILKFRQQRLQIIESG